ncbi:MAG TPA: hypothetical protein VNX68_02805 [Nitrosopumilaceae archaeon]|jgi:hypothetical protein|nr:hypothetical protein [Nitrosopumilaceae archaeon]
MEIQNNKKAFHVKAYLKKQLIEELNLSSAYEFDKIVKPHAEKVGVRMGNYYTPKQVRIIFDLVQTYKKTKGQDEKK